MQLTFEQLWPTFVILAWLATLATPILFGTRRTARARLPTRDQSPRR